jgi:uncharacterized protein
MEQIEPLYDKSLICTLCQKTFTSKKIRSRFAKISEYDTDFCPIYKDETNALFYTINVCPHCGYSSSDEFSKYFPPTTKKTIEDKVCSIWVPQDFGEKRTVDDAIKTYKLAAYCGGLKKEKHITSAGVFLRLAWLYRLKKEGDQEMRFMKLARKQYMDSYSTDDFKGTQMSELRILYLIGELSQRVSDTPAAIKHFSLVIERQKNSIEPKIIEMARDRWHEIRSAKEKNQPINS